MKCISIKFRLSLTWAVIFSTTIYFTFLYKYTKHVLGCQGYKMSRMKDAKNDV